MYVFNTFLNHAGKEENLDSTELKNINVTSKFTKFQVINKDFTRCRCNVFYTGRNRNYSDITEEASIDSSSFFSAVKENCSGVII